MKYETEFRDQLPVLGTGLKEVLLDGAIVDVTLTVLRLYFFPSEPYGGCVAACELEGRRVYLLVGSYHLLNELGRYRYRLPVTLRMQQVGYPKGLLVTKV